MCDLHTNKGTNGTHFFAYVSWSSIFKSFFLTGDPFYLAEWQWEDLSFLKLATYITEIDF